MKEINHFVMLAILALCSPFYAIGQGYADSDIQKIGDNRDSSTERANLTVRSDGATRTNDVSLIFVGQSDETSLEGVRPSGITRITKEGHEASFRDVNLQTYYYVHNRSGEKSFDFGSHKNGFVYLVTLRNVDLNALSNIREGRSSEYRWTDANTNRKYGSDRWRSDCGRGYFKGLAYFNGKIKSYNKGVQIATVMYDDNPENIGIYNGRTSNTRIMSVLDAWKQGDDAMAIGMKTTDGGLTSELHFRGTKCVRGNGENVLATFTLKPASGGGAGNGNWLISNCDSESGWSSSNIKSISSNYKEGRGSLKAIGSRTEDFRRTFTATNARGATALEFWYYVENLDKFESTNQVEIGSGSGPDTREYHWKLDKTALKNGWNPIKLRFADASITGGAPDITRLNWFRLYRKKNGTATSRIDYIRLTNGSNKLATQILPHTPFSTEQTYQLYPNPSKGTATLQLPMHESNGSATVSISNTAGQTVYSKIFNGLSKGTHQLLLDTPLSPALYLVEIQSKDSKRVLKLLVKD